MNLPEDFFAAMKADDIEACHLDNCICGHTDTVTLARVDRHGIPVDTLMCRMCGTVRLSWVPDSDWLYTSGWYRKLHTQRGTEDERFARGAAQYVGMREHFIGKPPQCVKKVKSAYHTRKGILVELGGDQGGFAEASKRDGWDAVNVEADPGDGVPRADLYVAIHVMEHIPDVVDWLGDLHAAAYGPQTRLIVVVPDLERVHVGEDVVSGGMANWWTIAHPWGWCTSNIAMPFAKAGWAVERVTRQLPGPLATVGSIIVEAYRGSEPDDIEAFLREGWKADRLNHIMRQRHPDEVGIVPVDAFPKGRLH